MAVQIPTSLTLGVFLFIYCYYCFIFYCLRILHMNKMCLNQIHTLPSNPLPLPVTFPFLLGFVHSGLPACTRVEDHPLEHSKPLRSHIPTEKSLTMALSSHQCLQRQGRKFMRPSLPMLGFWLASSCADLLHAVPASVHPCV